VKGERLPEAELGVIEARLSAAAVLKKVHDSNATMGEFLAAHLICAIHEEMNVREEIRPVSIAVPVNLRKYFNTSSARNFFSMINISHNFSTQGKDFDAVLKQVKYSFAEGLLPERITRQFNRLVALEHALYIKMVPLALKAPVFKTALVQAEKGYSATFSNMGNVTMPEKMVPYIRLFDMFNYSKHPQLCVCTFADVLCLSFSSPFANTGIQKNFFSALAERGLDIEIVSNAASLTGGNDVLP
jgi:NRPS condensation-like uncharacterized protein